MDIGQLLAYFLGLLYGLRPAHVLRHRRIDLVDGNRNYLFLFRHDVVFRPSYGLRCGIDN